MFGEDFGDISGARKQTREDLKNVPMSFDFHCPLDKQEFQIL